MAIKDLSELAQEFAYYKAINEQQYERRLREDPEIRSLLALRAKILSRRLESAFSAKPPGTDESAAQIEERIARLAEKKGIVKRVQCSKCGDTGMLGGDYCACLRAKAYIELYGAEDISKIADGLSAADLSVYADAPNAEEAPTEREAAKLAYRAATHYLRETDSREPYDLLIRGDVGVGKTTLLRRMAKDAAQGGADVCLIRAEKLFDAFLWDRLGESPGLSLLFSAELLIADDLGVEPLTKNVTVEYLYRMLEERRAKGKRTVIATNVQDLAARYTERVSSRLLGNGSRVLYLEGSDLRRR